MHTQKYIHMDMYTDKHVYTLHTYTTLARRAYAYVCTIIVSRR